MAAKRKNTSTSMTINNKSVNINGEDKTDELDNFMQELTKDFHEMIGDSYWMADVDDPNWSSKLTGWIEGVDAFSKKYEERKKPDIAEQVKELSGKELFQLSERDGAFVQQLVTTGLVLDALKKMTYDETRILYKKARPQMKPEIRRSAEDIIRDKRHKDSR